ncbi:MAG: FkbM family methyltransferase [Pseudobdellovibrionaceae bacterium]
MKIRAASMGASVVKGVKRLFNNGTVFVTKRHGINWYLDLDEGIDFAIYLLGRFENSTYEAYAKTVKPGAKVIDIGANIGAHTLPLATLVGDSGHVYAFEPTQTAFNKLQKNLSLNPELVKRVSLVQGMVVSSPSFELPDSIYASWPLHHNDQAHKLHLGVACTTTGAVSLTLDQIVQKFSIQQIDLIKLDVDGFELEVLRGATNTLDKMAPPILMELAPYTMEEKGYDAAEAVHILTKYGYEFYGLDGKSLSTGDLMSWLKKPGFSVNILAKTTRM